MVYIKQQQQQQQHQKKKKTPENNKGFYEKVEELESLFVAGGNIRWCSYRQTVQQFLK